MLHFSDIQNSKLLRGEVNSFKKKFEVNTKDNRSSSQEEVLFIDTNEVFVIESNITTSYIFQIVLASTTDNSNVVDNLVITDNGERFEQYVTRYFFTDEEIDNIEAIDYSTLRERTFFLDIDVDTDSILEGRSKRNSRSTLYSCPPGKCCTSETSQGTGWTIYETVPCNNQSPTTIIGVDENDPYENGGGGTTDGTTGGNSNNNNNDPYDDYDPQNGGIFNDGGGGTTTGSGPNNNTTILTNPVFGSLLFLTINSYLETPLTDEQEEWLLENQASASLIQEYLVSNQDFDVTLNDALNSVITANSITPWEIISGNINEVSSLDYFKKRTHNYPGGPVVEYALNNGDYVCYGDYGQGSEIDEKWFYSSTSDNLPYWYEIPEPSTYDHTDLDFIFNAFWSGAALPLVRYATPLEDIIILIDGHNFEGVAESQAVAGVFIIIDLVPGGKVLKIVKKVGGPILDTAPIITKIATPLYKGQKEITKQVLDGTIALSNSLRKGNFAEMLIDTEWFERGYKRLHTNPTTHLNQGGHGIDHIFKNEQTGEFIIVETKYGTGSIQQANLDTGLPRQMSDDWIADIPSNTTGMPRLLDALGGDTSLFNQIDGNYTRVIAKVSPQGNIIYKKIMPNGFLETGADATFNP